MVEGFSSCSEWNPVYSVIYDKKKKRLLPGHHWIIFFKRIDRIEFSKDPESVSSASELSEIGAALPLLLVIILQLYHLLYHLLLQSVTLLALLLIQQLEWLNSYMLSKMTASVSQLLYCTVVLFKVLYFKMKNGFFIFCISLYLCIICVRSIINLLWYSII